MLALPFIAYVSQIEEIADGSLRVQRMVEDGYEVIESPLPAVVTVVNMTGLSLICPALTMDTALLWPRALSLFTKSTRTYRA